MVSLRDAKEKFNKENATVYYKPKEGAWKELETSAESGGSGDSSFASHKHKIPDETQAGDVWSADAEANAPNAVYDVAIDPDLVLWFGLKTDLIKLFQKNNLKFNSQHLYEVRADFLSLHKATLHPVLQ